MSGSRDMVWERCERCGLGELLTAHVVAANGTTSVPGMVPSPHLFVPSGVYRQPGEGDWAQNQFLRTRDWWSP